MNKPENRRKHEGSNVAGALERFLGDAESGKFPIRHRNRDCERINIHAQTLNILHVSRKTDELRTYMAKMLLAIIAEESGLSQ
jgi:hypothetical protein